MEREAERRRMWHLRLRSSQLLAACATAAAGSAAFADASLPRTRIHNARGATHLASWLPCATDPNMTTYCPAPIWPITWQLNQSTIAQPSNESGWVNPRAASRWALTSIDWGMGAAIWGKYPPMAFPAEEMLVEQAAMIKAFNPQARVFVYRNMELALQCLRSEREAMYNVSTADYFLQYTDGKGRKNGTIYNEPSTSSNRNPVDQFFWDFREQGAQDYFINTVVMGVGGMGAPGGVVDGVYTDDVDGLGEEHADAILRMNLTQDEVYDIRNATLHTWDRMLSTLIPAGGYNWQAFRAGDGLVSPPSPSTCAADMRWHCSTPLSAPYAIQVDMQAVNVSIATFLIARTPHAWLGWGWVGPTLPEWVPLFDLDVGEPLGTCIEVAPGQFVRGYSKGSATLDCITYTATLNFGY